MEKQATISVIVAALNEERNIERTVEKVVESANRFFDDFEVLIFDDGSTDRTGEIADRLAVTDDKIRAFHHSRPHNLGGVFRHGLKQAVMNYLILVNGKNDVTTKSLDTIFALHGKADLVVPFIANIGERPLSRRIISHAFTFVLNLSFGLRLKYFNESVLHIRENLSGIKIRTDSYAFQAETLIKLIKSGRTYFEVGVTNRYEQGIGTKAFKACGFGSGSCD